MPTFPIARLQSLSEEEKIKLSGIFRRKLLFRASLFFTIMAVSIAVILFFNKYISSYKVEDNLDVINVVFVIITALFARLIFSEFMEFGKEIRSPNKKVIHTKIAGRNEGKIFLGNKSFAKDEILLDSSDFDFLQKGDDVQIEISARSNTLFSVKKL